MDPWPEYERYISSPHWAARRERYFRNHKKACAGCGSTYRIQLHHLDYKRLGNEADEDLMPLCVTCHRGVHSYHRRYKSPSLRVSTHRYVASRKRRRRRA